MYKIVVLLIKPIVFLLSRCRLCHGILKSLLGTIKPGNGNVSRSNQHIKQQLCSCIPLFGTFLCLHGMISLCGRVNLTSVGIICEAVLRSVFCAPKDSMNYWKCLSNFLPCWLANQQWLFLTGQSWHVLKSWYTGGNPEQEFWHCFADGLNQSLISSVVQPTAWQLTYENASFYL